MKKGWTRRKEVMPLYVLPRGVKVFNEVTSGRYVMLVIEARPELFPNTKVTGRYARRQKVQRSRIIMTLRLGRPLDKNEHVHHRNEKTHDDRPRNLKLSSADDHNRHHHLGMKHTPKIKRQIATSMRRAHLRGSHSHLKGKNHPWSGKTHTKATKEKMRRSALKRWHGE